MKKLFILSSMLAYLSICNLSFGSSCLFSYSKEGCDNDYLDMSEEPKYSSNLDSYTDFKSSYFDNLTKNFGMNYKGSCGYVAIGMVLSYYDTYLNDDIIPEQYDIKSVGSTNDVVSRRNSPGIYRDTYIRFDGHKPGEIDSSKYLSTIKNDADHSFHAKLITIGDELGYYDSRQDDSCSTNFDKRISIMNKYFTDVIGYKENVDYSYSYCDGKGNYSANSKAVREFTIEQIKEGNPVILAIRSTNGKSSDHAAVAYDYDEEKDKIYCHMGWKADTTHVTIESQKYSIYKSACVINFNGSHSHSDNYGISNISDLSTNYYCYHNPNIDAKVTNVKHPYVYTKYTSSKHIVTCECGINKQERHSVYAKNQYTVGFVTYNTCAYCKELINVTKTPVNTIE